MSPPCKFVGSAWALLCCALVLTLPAIVKAAPTPEGLAFLGVSVLEQPDAKLSELIGRRLSRMGEDVLPRVRIRHCKEIACFNELSQTPALRQARFLLSAEIYQSDARQQSITVRLFDVEHRKLEESVEGCEQCDDDRRSELILVKYGQLRQSLTSPPPSPELPLAPYPSDACPNLEGTQPSVPDGMTTDSGGNCVPNSQDLCLNVPGVQSEIPKGMILHKLANCMQPLPSDLCMNLDGLQKEVPAGMEKDANGVCTAMQIGSALANRKQKYRIASAIVGGIAIGLLIPGIIAAAQKLPGPQYDCPSQTGNHVCPPAFVLPVVELGSAGLMGFISAGLAIPLLQRN